MGDVLVQDGPKPLDHCPHSSRATQRLPGNGTVHVYMHERRIEVWAIRRQLDQIDTTSWPGKKSPDIGVFVVGGIVSDDMNDALVGVALLDLGEKLGSTDPINGSPVRQRVYRMFRGAQPHECSHDHAPPVSA